MMLKRAVFLDRDGVFNKMPKPIPDFDRSNYILSWHDWEWADGAIEGLKLLYKAGYELIVVSNQQCVGKGYISYQEANNIMVVMRNALRELHEVNVHFSLCPHLESDNCACRMPKPGMIWRGAVEHQIDLSQSWMIGDSISDVEAAYKSGIPIQNMLNASSDTLIFNGQLQYWWGVVSLAPYNSLLEAARKVVGE